MRHTPWIVVIAGSWLLAESPLVTILVIACFLLGFLLGFIGQGRLGPPQLRGQHRRDQLSLDLRREGTFNRIANPGDSSRPASGSAFRKVSCGQGSCYRKANREHRSRTPTDPSLAAALASRPGTGSQPAERVGVLHSLAVASFAPGSAATEPSNDRRRKLD